MELFSHNPFPNAPVFMNLNCELAAYFARTLNASMLSLTLPKRFRVSIGSMANYAKAFWPGNEDDRFFLGLYCHATTYRSGLREASLPAMTEALFFGIRVPIPRFAMLWVTATGNFWEDPRHRLVAAFTKIYVSWDHGSEKLTPLTATGTDEKWYDDFLALYIGDFRAPRIFNLGDFRFGKSSILHLRVSHISVWESCPGKSQYRTGVELHVPGESNFSVNLIFMFSPRKPSVMATFSRLLLYALLLIDFSIHKRPDSILLSSSGRGSCCYNSLDMVSWETLRLHCKDCLTIG